MSGVDEGNTRVQFQKVKDVDNPMLQAALEYQARDWSLIPMQMGRGKQPACKWRPYQTIQADAAQLGEWFGNGSGFGLAVVFGTVSDGLGARDFDTMEAYNAWAAENPKLAQTLPTVATNRGRHVYFRITQEQESAVRQALDKPGGKGAIDFDDGELRIGIGAYAVLPPSKHPDGGHYRWLNPLTAEIPLVDLRDACLLKGTVRHREYRECPLNTLSSLSSLRNDPVEQAIANTMPNGFRQRHELLFEFARELKAMPDLADAPAEDLKPYARRWHEKAKPFLRWSFEETWLDIVESWDKVKYPKGGGPVDMAFQTVLETELPEVAMQYDTAEMRQLVSLCRELQRAAGPDNQFFLAARTGERLLGVSYKTVASWLRLLRRDGILKLVEPGNAGACKAHRYRYLKGI